MSAPDSAGPPWREAPPGSDPDASEFGGALDQARRVRPVMPHDVERGWRAVAQSVASRSERSSSWRIPALAATVLGVIIAVGVWRGAGGATEVALAGVGHLRFEKGARYQIEPTRAGAAQRITLSSGVLVAQVEHQTGPNSVVIEAPHLEVVVVGTHFRITAGETRSQVEVQEGQVRAGHPGGASVLVSGGEALASDDARLDESAAPPVSRAGLVSAAKPAVPGCVPTQSLEERRSCYRTVGAGTGLAAQNAAFALAVLERDEAHDVPAARAALQDYRVRFPQGAFRPEVELTDLDLLLAQGKLAEARAAAESFAQNFPTDGRLDHVKLIEAQLLQHQQHELDRALVIYRDLSQVSKRRDVVEEALFQRGVCEEALGQREQAQSTFSAYQAQFPQGLHSGAVAAHLHP